MFNQKGFSKIAVIIIVLILIGGVYFIFGKKGEKIPDQDTENESNLLNQSSNEDLSSLIKKQETDKERQLEKYRTILYGLTKLCEKEPDKCIFDEHDDASIGIAKLTGYYNKGKCDEFVVKSGTEKIIKSLRDWIEQGNTVNRIDNQGNLVINIDIDLASVSKEMRDIIVKTNSGNPIALDVFRKNPAGREVGNCYSFITIFSDIFED